MDLKQQILHYYRVGEMSLREIARRTGADRKRVTRLIDAYEAAIKSEPDLGIDEFLATRPKYTSRKYAPRVMRDAVAKEIERCGAALCGRRPAKCGVLRRARAGDGPGAKPLPAADYDRAGHTENGATKF